MLDLDDSVQRIPGVGPARAGELRNAGIFSVGDLLMVLPLRYEDRSEVTPVGELEVGQRTGVQVSVRRVRRKGPPGRRQQVEMLVEDDTGELLVVWFNQPYMARRFEAGDRVHLYGLVQEYEGRLQVVNPVVADEDAASDSPHVGRAVPIYRRIGGLGAGQLRRIVLSTLSALRTPDHLPAHVADELDLLATHEALAQLHYPPDGAPLAQWEQRRSEAHRALVTTEFIDFQIVLLLQRRRAATEPGYAHALDLDAAAEIVAALPFDLTAAQDRVLEDVLDGLQSPEPMQRLVQGDVGCGKTAVLGTAAFAVARAGGQAAVLAPTEILARQHADALGDWGAKLGVEVLSLTGSDAAASRREFHERLNNGGGLVAVGTHALLEPGVRFRELGLVVVDEQHRFGVGQRAALRDKGKEAGRRPDLLVTTATPIPRSLALTLYGDLEVSRIDELPAGRQPVVTSQRGAERRNELISKLTEVLAARGRAYVVVPEIAADPDSAVGATPADVESVATALHRHFGEAVGVLHGRLDAAAKADAVRAFADGVAPILVCTTVVEVGVDVPAATFMAIIRADRFGLAQLHQLRGRVGRGNKPSECWLLVDEDISDDAATRIATLCATNDGFEIAERDLELRGAGELLGYRQTGPFGFRIANPRLHADWLSAAAPVAEHLADSDDEAAVTYRQLLRDRWRTRMQLTRAG